MENGKGKEGKKKTSAVYAGGRVLSAFSPLIFLFWLGGLVTLAEIWALGILLNISSFLFLVVLLSVDKINRGSTKREKIKP